MECISSIRADLLDEPYQVCLLIHDEVPTNVELCRVVYLIGHRCWADGDPVEGWSD